MLWIALAPAVALAVAVAVPDDPPRFRAALPPPAPLDRDCGWGRFGAGRWPGACWRPYGRSSPFNQVLPRRPRIARHSRRTVRQLLAFGDVANLTAGEADTRADYWHPVYFSRGGDPVFRLDCYEASWGTCPIEGHTVRIPDAARPAAGGDAHLTVVDQGSGWEYDLYKVRSKPSGGGTLEFRWGGRTRIDGDGLRSDATAAGFGGLAGIVRTPELQAGRIPHALFLTAKCDSGRFVYPATGSGFPCSALGLPSAGTPPMGMRLQLAMSAAKIDALDVPSWQKVILRAMARYGMFLGDTGGGSWGIQLESGSTYTSFGRPDPLVAFAKANGWIAHGGKWVGALRDAVDWARHLRVIHPCVSRRTC